VSGKSFKSLFSKKKDEEAELRTYIRSIIGYTPKNFELFRLARIHHSASTINPSGAKESNERLEYLGDAILGAIIAEYLFKKYPYKEEGFLTEIRSRIVSRESLNLVGHKLGLKGFIVVDKSVKSPGRSASGDALEALIGAVYLDRGFSYCRKFVINQLLEPYYDIDQLILSGQNAKSKLIEWSQKENVEVEFETVQLKDLANRKEFTVQVSIQGEVPSTGFGPTKKKAEQDAAKKALESLNL
jgi:ribonuclease-3